MTRVTPQTRVLLLFSSNNATRPLFLRNQEMLILSPTNICEIFGYRSNERTNLKVSKKPKFANLDHFDYYSPYITTNGTYERIKQMVIPSLSKGVVYKGDIY